MFIKRGELLEITPFLDEEGIEDLSVLEWDTTDEDIASIEVTETTVEIQTHQAGEVTITLKYKSQEIEQEFLISGPESIEVEGPDTVAKGETFTLNAFFVFEDASKEEINPASITWESLTTSATVSEEGEVSITAHGHVQIQAEIDGLDETWEKMIECNYPEPTDGNFGVSLEHNTVIPPLYWDKAFTAKEGAPTRVDFQDIYCSDEFDWVSTINLMITAGWCPACPDYMRAINDLNPELKEAGGLMIYVDVQDNDYGPADSAFADAHLSRVLGEGAEGYFVGDLDTLPVSRFFGQSPAIEAFPDSYVVRRSDMTILTSLNLNRNVGLMPLVEIAQNPNNDWSELDSTPPPPFESICNEGDDEPSEPNNTEDQAGLIMVGTMDAGICDENPDLFNVDIEGSWTVRIDFLHSQSDLDLYLLGPGGIEDMPAMASNGQEDFEEITGEGPGTLLVLSYNRQSTLYSLTLSEN
jgi:hypothetical protein